MTLLKMKNITKIFSGVLANDNINMSVREGEIHALLGENGAGKTTLMNIIYGLYQADRGEIYWENKLVNINSPDDAIKLGIGMVHQHFMLVKPMTVLQNIVLGLREDDYPIFNKHKTEKKVTKIIDKYGLTLPLDEKIENISVGMQQRVEIVKTLYRDAKLLILDEPTAVLTPQETKELFKILLNLKKLGHSIILISHNLSEIISVSDRVTVLRDGKAVYNCLTKDTSERELSRYMVGREVIFKKYKRSNSSQEIPKLSLKNLTLYEKQKKTLLDNVSFDIYPNEVVGVAGVDGNGQTELAEIITGIRKQSTGQVFFKNKNIDKTSIRDRAALGIAYIPADRHRDGLIMDASLKYNLHLNDYFKYPFSNHTLLNQKALKKSSLEQIEKFNIKTSSLDNKVRLLSGGNQQKAILARELKENAQVIVACQPTRGLDIGATVYIRDLLIHFRDDGGSVILISTDLNEILSMSDRIIVMYRGKIMGIVENTCDISAEMIGLMMGGKTLLEIS